MFTQENESKLKILGDIFDKYLNYNDKRVANATGEALEILLVNFDKNSENKENLGRFKKLFGMDAADVAEEFFIACYNTAQYERGLEMCGELEKFSVLQPNEILSEKAQFYGHMGEFDKAEALLKQALEQDPSDVWNYINFGNLYYTWQVLPENQDLRRAEDWYYKAFDAQIGIETEDGEVLIEALGDVCVERLRRSAEKKLLRLLTEYNIGGWQAIWLLRQTAEVSSSESVVFNHLQMKILKKINDFKKANAALHILTLAYNFMPQDVLDGLCPFQMAEYYGEGEHRNRLMGEMFDAYGVAVKEGEAPTMMGAEGAEAFTEFQIKFMEGIDKKTGEIRHKLLSKEEKEIKKLIKGGRYLWMGFLKYRNVDNPDIV